MMWVLLAFLSALFAGLTSVFAKCGIRETDSTVATGLRTIVVLFMSLIMVQIAGSAKEVASIAAKTWVFLILSGLATGASWLCYFKALQLGDLNKVAAVDKFSVVLTILMAFFFLREPITWLKGLCVLCIGAGTYWMLEKKDISGEKAKGHVWLIYAILSAIFAALTSILGKIGIQGVEANLGTAIRTAVVLIMAWVMVGITGKGKKLRGIPLRELGFICLSGLATGASWLCYYKALQDGLASVVVPVDKLSLLITVAFSRFVFGEKLTKKGMAGLALITLGTLGMLI